MPEEWRPSAYFKVSTVYFQCCSETGVFLWFPYYVGPLEPLGVLYIKLTSFSKENLADVWRQLFEVCILPRCCPTLLPGFPPQANLLTTFHAPPQIRLCVPSPSSGSALDMPRWLVLLTCDTALQCGPLGQGSGVAHMFLAVNI